MVKGKGQALVEFILVLPILIMILLAIIDFGNILYQKYLLADTIDNVVLLYNKNNQLELDKYVQDENILVNYNIESPKKTISVSKSVSITTPGLGKIIGDPYKIEVKRVIFDE